MMRSLLLAGGFLVVTIALLFLQPSQPLPEGDLGFEAAPVTRAETNSTGSFGLNQSGPSATTAPAVTRAQSSTGSVAVPSQRLGTSPASEVETPVGNDPVQSQVAMMTRNILDELRAGQSTPVATSAPPAAPEPSPSVEAQILAADNSGASNEQLIQLLSDAVAAGLIEVGAAFLTTHSEIDYPALLAYYAPGRAPAAPTDVAQDFLYRVQPGDSIGGLAIAFYGDAQKHGEIVRANAGVLGTGQRIVSGLLLTVPAL